MKIGILTLPLETNYGGLLQAFALQKVLRDMGHDVMTIDRHNPKRYRSFLHNCLSFGKRLKLHYLDGKDVSVCWNGFMPDEVYKTLSRNTQKFIDRNIRLTRNVLSTELGKIDAEYQFDAYVVGSDQVWLKSYCPATFLPFVRRKDVIKITYAASCGSTSWADSEELTEQCRLLVKDFRAISTREANLAQLAKEKLGVDAVHVLDPTMLLSSDDYLAAITPQRSEPCLFSYVLDKSAFKQHVVESLSKNLKLGIVQGNVGQYYVKKRNIDAESCVFPSVDNWINGFNNASFVVTDSFHGTVFSILFRKPFVVIGNKRRGIERFNSLLGLFGLQDRMVFSVEESIQKMQQQIDYSQVETKLEKLREESQMFLETNLK